MLSDDVTGLDVARIGRCALHGCLYDVRRFDCEVWFDYRPDRVVEQSELVLFPAVKIRVPMPGRVSARAACAECEEIGIGASTQNGQRCGPGRLWETQNCATQQVFLTCREYRRAIH